MTVNGDFKKMTRIFIGLILATGRFSPAWASTEYEPPSSSLASTPGTSLSALKDNNPNSPPAGTAPAIGSTGFAADNGYGTLLGQGTYANWSGYTVVDAKTCQQSANCKAATDATTGQTYYEDFAGYAADHGGANGNPVTAICAMGKGCSFNNVQPINGATANQVLTDEAAMSSFYQTGLGLDPGSYTAMVNNIWIDEDPAAHMPPGGYGVYAGFGQGYTLIAGQGTQVELVSNGNGGVTTVNGGFLSNVPEVGVPGSGVPQGGVTGLAGFGAPPPSHVPLVNTDLFVPAPIQTSNPPLKRQDPTQQ